MAETKIEWCEKVWNPVTGCTPAGAGCKNCYARTMHRRLRAMGQPKYQHDFERPKFHLNELNRPRDWRKPRMVFVNSMSDLFHPDVPDPFIHSVFTIMRVCHWHTFQVLTKRADRMRQILAGMPVLPNVWLGASASTQPDLDRVVHDLLGTPAAVRFLSLEPLLGPINLRECGFSGENHYDALDAADASFNVNWVIVGAESGPHRRPCDPRWIEDIVAQCQTADVPVFVKQGHDANGRVVKMPEVFGRTWEQMP